MYRNIKNKKIKKKKKRKKRQSTSLPKELNSEARLQNGTMLGTHFAQTESGLLDSNDHYIPFLYDIE